MKLGERPALYLVTEGDQCTMPDLEVRNLSAANLSSECPRWDYAREIFPETAISQFDLVCSREFWVGLSQSIYLFGDVIGSILSGLLSDKFGRKHIILISTAGYFLSGIGVIFAPTIIIFNILRWCTALFATSICTVSFTYCMEIVSGNWTTFVGVLYGISGALGFMCVPILSWIFPRWTILQLAITCPIIVIFVLPLWILFFPESPRWLTSQGMLGEAMFVMEKISQKSGNEPAIKNINNGMSTDMGTLDSVSVSLCDLFRKTGICRSTVVLSYSWFCFVSIYNCLILDTKNLIPGQLFVNIEIISGLEVLAALVSIPILSFAPRKISVTLCIICTGACFLASTFVEDKLLQQVLAQVGQFSNTINYLIMLVFTAEIYPTAIRNMGLGFCSAIGKIGASLVPLLITPGDGGLTIRVLGLLTLAEVFVVLLLPETFKKDLANTVDEGELFNKKFGGFRCFDREKTYILSSAT